MPPPSGPGRSRLCPSSSHHQHAWTIAGLLLYLVLRRTARPPSNPGLKLDVSQYDADSDLPRPVQCCPAASSSSGVPCWGRKQFISVRHLGTVGYMSVRPRDAALSSRWKVFPHRGAWCAWRCLALSVQARWIKATGLFCRFPQWKNDGPTWLCRSLLSVSVSPPCS